MNDSVLILPGNFFSDSIENAYCHATEADALKAASNVSRVVRSEAVVEQHNAGFVVYCRNRFVVATGLSSYLT